MATGTPRDGAAAGQTLSRENRVAELVGQPEAGQHHDEGGKQAREEGEARRHQTVASMLGVLPSALCPLPSAFLSLNRLQLEELFERERADFAPDTRLSCSRRRARGR